MKRLITILITALMIVSCMAVAASAATPTGSVQGSVTAINGDQITVTFDLVSCDGINSYGVNLVYDASKLELVSMTPGALCSLASSGYANWASAVEATSGNLFSATFKLLTTECDARSVGLSFVGGAATSNSAGEPATISVAPAVYNPGHSYGNWTVTKAADCKNEGSQERTCSVCGHVDTSVIPVDANNHVGPIVWRSNDVNHWHVCNACGVTTDSAQAHTYGSWTQTKAPTETEPGLKVHKCTSCGYEESGVIPALGHTCSFGAWTEVTPATCTAEGLEKRVCSCGNFETRPIAKKAHELKAEWANDETNHWHVCKNCGTKVDVAAHKWSAYKADASNHWHVCEDCGLKAHEGAHDFHWVIDKAATKTEDGWRHKECRICFYELAGEVIPAGKDDVPQTGDITPHITMTVLAMVSMLGAVAYVFKRKAAK